MYNDPIKVSNKIITNTDLLDIFQKMNDKLQECEKLSKEEISINQNYERVNQHWSLKGYSGTFKVRFNFYDATSITVDNYIDFMSIFNSRIQEVKDMYVSFGAYYTIQHNGEMKSINHHIYIYIYEHKMDIDVKLSSEDKRFDDIFQLIKDKIQNAPEKYDRIVKKKDTIRNKIGFAIGFIPAIVLCTLLVFVSAIRELYGSTYVLYPFMVLLLSYAIGPTLFTGHLQSLYSNIVPEKKYAGYDKTNYKSVYKDDIDKYTSTSEIIIGKNINNLKNRKEIAELETKYSKYIPKELIVLVVLSIVMIIIGKVF